LWNVFQSTWGGGEKCSELLGGKVLEYDEPAVLAIKIKAISFLVIQHTPEIQDSKRSNGKKNALNARQTPRCGIQPKSDAIKSIVVAATTAETINTAATSQEVFGCKTA